MAIISNVYFKLYLMTTGDAAASLLTRRIIVSPRPSEFEISDVVK